VLSYRFEIQDIVAQDSSGVTYLACDADTGSPLAVQRFFPFGADGGGLFDEQLSEYAAIVDRLVGLQHPGLRALLSGGCDPVDGMPFVASEWIEGESLAELLQLQPYTSADVLDVLERVLEISQALSDVLGTDAVWVETATELIIDDAGENRRGLTFELAPMKWLGHQDSRHSLLPLAELTEDLLGWRRNHMPNQAGQGLGAWVKWLRANADATTLRQARAHLVRLTGETVARNTVSAAGHSRWPLGTTPPALRDELSPPNELPMHPLSLKKPFFKQPWVLLTALVLLVGLAGAGAWWQLRHPVAHAASNAALAGKVFASGETQLIMQAVSREVTVEGLLAKIGPGPDGFWYVDFQGSTLGREVQGYFKTAKPSDELSAQALSVSIGQRIRITGRVEMKITPKEKWPLLLLKNPQAIQPVK